MSTLEQVVRRRIWLAEFHEVMADEAEADGDRRGAEMQARNAARLYASAAHSMLAGSDRAQVVKCLERSRIAYERARTRAGQSRFYRETMRALGLAGTMREMHEERRSA